MSTGETVRPPEETPILTGPRLRLTPFTEADVSDRYLSWLNDPDVTRFLEVRHVAQTRDTALAFVRSFSAGVEKYMWCIRTADGAAIGTTTLSNINRLHGGAELGLMIGEKAEWGYGASAEAINLVARFAFDTLGLRRLSGGSYARNHGMNFTFRRLGFTLEGKQRQALMMTPGEYVDGLRWGLLADEWRAGESKRADAR